MYAQESLGGKMVGLARAESPSQYIPPTTRQRLELRKSELTKQLTDIEAALSALNGNPGAEQLLDTLAKVSY